MTINQSSTWFSILEATAKQPVENIKRHRTRELTQSNTVNAVSYLPKYYVIQQINTFTI